MCPLGSDHYISIFGVQLVSFRCIPGTPCIVSDLSIVTSLLFDFPYQIGSRYWVLNIYIYVYIFSYIYIWGVGRKSVLNSSLAPTVEYIYCVCNTRGLRHTLGLLQRETRVLVHVFPSILHIKSAAGFRVPPNQQIAFDQLGSLLCGW